MSRSRPICGGILLPQARAILINSLPWYLESRSYNWYGVVPPRRVSHPLHPVQFVHHPRTSSITLARFRPAAWSERYSSA
jgi:hypothetical protein